MNPCKLHDLLLPCENTIVLFMCSLKLYYFGGDAKGINNNKYTMLTPARCKNELVHSCVNHKNCKMPFHCM